MYHRQTVTSPYWLPAAPTRDTTRILARIESRVVTYSFGSAQRRPACFRERQWPLSPAICAIFLLNVALKSVGLGWSLCAYSCKSAAHWHCYFVLVLLRAYLLTNVRWCRLWLGFRSKGFFSVKSPSFFNSDIISFTVTDVICVFRVTATIFGSLLLRAPPSESTKQQSEQPSSVSRPREESRRRANFMWHFLISDYDD